MKNKLKSPKGVISVFAMLAMLFFLLFILGAYMAVSRSNRTQKESNDEILKIYSTEANAQDIYDEMISNTLDVIPIYTYEQVNDVRQNVFYAINEMIYDFQLNKFDFGELKTNLNISGLNDKTTNNYTDIDAGEYQYVKNESLKLSLDGTNNTGEGYSSEVAKWSNLATINGSSYEYDIYGGGKNPLTEVTWTGNGLAFDGVGDYVLCDDIIYSGNSSQTLEIVFQTFASKNQRLLGSWGNESGGGLSITSTGLRGDFILEGNVNSSITSTTNIQPNKTTYAALTFDGNKIRLYKNGKKVSEDSDNTIDKATTETITYKTVDTVESFKSDLKVKLGMKATIGSSGSIASNFMLAPYFISEKGYTSGNLNADSTIYIKTLDQSATSQTGTTYSQNIASCKDEKSLEFKYNILTAGTDVIIPVTFEYSKGLKIGNTDTESSFSIMATGTDSVVIRSNVGKVQTWYFNGVPKGPSITNGEVEILGTYYYSFDGLEPNTEYEIYAEFKSSETGKWKIKAVTGKHADTIFVGNSYNNKFDGRTGGSFDGIIYAVRVYDKALTADQIGANYKIDKSRFSIID